MTPDQFAERMRWAARIYPDNESRHKAMDSLLADALDALGYDKGVDIYREAEKHYSRKDADMYGLP